MMNIPILQVPESRWECPNCNFTDVTREVDVHSRFHNCAGLGGMSTPMIPAGTKAKVEAVEREDYIGQANVQVNDEGRPIMSVVTTRDEGQDCSVYAECASSSATVE